MTGGTEIGIGLLAAIEMEVAVDTGDDGEGVCEEGVGTEE